MYRAAAVMLCALCVSLGRCLRAPAEARAGWRPPALRTGLLRLRGGLAAGAHAPGQGAEAEAAVARLIEAAKNASKSPGGVCWGQFPLRARCAPLPRRDDPPPPRARADCLRCGQRRVSCRAPETCPVACGAGDIWLEHAMARCESELRPLPPQVASAPAGVVACTLKKPRMVGRRMIDSCLARQISKASPFLPLLVAPGGLDTVKLLQRRMLLDRYYETSTFDARPPSLSAPVVPATTACAHHSASVPEPDAVVGRASALGVMGPEGVLALQVNAWEPLIENVTEAEQREFVHKFTQIDVADEVARTRLLRKFSGRLGKVICCV